MAKRFGSTAPPVRQSNWRESAHPTEGTTLAVPILNLAVEGDSSVLSLLRVGIGHPQCITYEWRVNSRMSHRHLVCPGRLTREFQSTGWITRAIRQETGTSAETVSGGYPNCGVRQLLNYFDHQWCSCLHVRHVNIAVGR